MMHVPAHKNLVSPPAQSGCFPLIGVGCLKRPDSLWGRATLLLGLLYRDGLLPDLHAYGLDDAPGLYIAGIFAGATDAEITAFIWRAVESNRLTGFCFH